MSDEIRDTEAADQQSLKDFEARERAIALLKKSGLPFPSKPAIPEDYLDENGNLKRVTDITQLTDRELGTFMSVWTALSVYAQVIVAIADIDHSSSERVASFSERQEILKLSKEDRKNEDLRYGHVHKIPDVQARRYKEFKDLAVYKLAQALLSGYEKDLMLLSREITRRSNLQAWEKREANVSER